MIDCVYFNDDIRCYRNGVVERIDKNFKKREWRIVENTANCNKYNHLKINGKMIFRHRIMAYCFLGLENIVGKKNNDNCIDHINGNRIDNRVENLRITTQRENQFNRPNAKGYCWIGENKKWRAQIRLNGKIIYLGLYDTEEEAHQAYLRAKPIYHII